MSSYIVRIVFLVVVLVFCSLSWGAQDSDAPAQPTGEPQVTQEEGWIPLFNGKDLSGWTMKFTGQELGTNLLDTVRVKDGMIQMNYENWERFNGRFGHLFYKSPYSSYRLRCEYRFTGEQTLGGPGWAYRNSGLMLHCQDPATMRLDQEFPVSVEVQLLDGFGRPTANLCTPGTNVEMNGRLHRQHCTNSTSKKFDGEQWVQVEVRVDESGVRHFINGEEVLAYTRPQLDSSDPDGKALLEKRKGEAVLTEGWIALQGESHPVDFRNIEIMPLKSTPAPVDKDASPAP